jgi:hypothetical protein
LLRRSRVKAGKIRNAKDYWIAWAQYPLVFSASNKLDEIYPRMKQIPGICDVCGRPRLFVNDLMNCFQYGGKSHINFRERMVCPVCGLNNRMRSTMSVILREMKRYVQGDMLIYEAVTLFYQRLEEKTRRKNWNIVGTEYFGPSYESGALVNGIRNEDAAALSFADQSFDMIVSNDVFEHVPNLDFAMAEMYRVLRPGGVAIFTVPIDVHRDASLQRARIEDGKIVHLEEPEYHGDPLSDKGCLAFWTIGWDILDRGLYAGFEEAYAEPKSNLLHGNIMQYPHVVFIFRKAR